MDFFKRALPFALTLLVGIMLGNFAGLSNRSSQVRSNRTTDGNFSRSYRSCHTFQKRHSYNYGRLQILNKPEAKYTEEARLAGIEGTVRLRALFDADGAVKSIQPLTVLPYGLTDSAIRAAHDIEFVPETMNGANVPVERLIEYSFSLY